MNPTLEQSPKDTVDEEQARWIKNGSDRALISEIGSLFQPGTALGAYHIALVEELEQRYWELKRFD